MGGITTQLTAEQAAKLNDDNPTNQMLGLGSIIKEAQEAVTASEEDIEDLQAKVGGGDEILPLLTIEKAITASASAGISVITDSPLAFRVVGVKVESRASSASGTVKITDEDDHDITDAITMAVDKATNVDSSIDATYSSIAVGEGLKAVTHGADDRGIVTVLVRPVIS